MNRGCFGLLGALAIVAALSAPAAAASDEPALTSRGYLGVVLAGGEDEDGGVRIAGVGEGTAAAKAGLAAGDLVLEVNGERVRDAADLAARIGKLTRGQSAKLKIRRNGEDRLETVVLGEAPKAGKECGPGCGGGMGCGKSFDKMIPRGFGPGQFHGQPGQMGGPMGFRLPVPPRVRMGVMLQDLTPGLRRYFRVAGDGGVLVSDITAGSAAEKAGVAAGDIIVNVGGKEAKSAGDVIEAIRELKAGDRVSLSVLRDGAERTLDVVLEERPESESMFLPRHFGGEGAAPGQHLEMTPELEARIKEALEKAQKTMRDVHPRMRAFAGSMDL